MAQSVDAVILCALDVEYKAVRRRLARVSAVEHPAGTLYEVGQLPKTGQTVALVVTGAGDPASAGASERAIQHFAPDRACFVGIAGGLKDVHLGDVVVADRVIAYERAKVTDQGLLPRMDSKPSTSALVDRARAIARAGTWRQRLPKTVRALIEPHARVGTIAAGAKVLASVRSETYRYLQAYCSDALAVEMEGFGFLESAWRNPGVDAIVIRGISDLLSKDPAHDAEWQPVASESAAAFAVEVLTRFPSKGSASQRTSGPRRQSSLASGAKPRASGASSSRRSRSARFVTRANTAFQSVCAPHPILRLELRDDGEPASPRLGLVAPGASSMRLALADTFSATTDIPEDAEQAVRAVLRAATIWPAAADQQSLSLPGPMGTPAQRDSEVLAHLQQHKTVTLVGPSASGKTYTAVHAASYLRDFGWTVSVIDTGNPAAGLDALLLQLVRTTMGAADKHLFVVDNVQGNPGLAQAAFELIARLEGAMAVETVCLAITWPQGLSIVRECRPDSQIVQCHGEDVLTTLVHETAIPPEPALVERIRTLSGGDALIARLALEHYEHDGTLPSPYELAAAAFSEITAGQTISDKGMALLYELAVLGQFEVDVAAAYASRADLDALNELIGLGVVRLFGPFVTVGHRTLASLVAAYAGATLGSVVGPVKIVVDYLKAAGDAQLVATLQRLDLVKLSRTGKDQHGSAFLASAWHAASVLTRYSAYQTRLDPTWGDNMASAIFAAEPLARFDRPAWELIAEFVRSRWVIDSSSLPLPSPVGDLTTERIDFDEIAKRMHEEDERHTSAPALPVAAVDLDRMHGTWLVGLLLGFEAFAPSRSPARVTELVASAVAAQGVDGWFYPPRVPWITARVLLGLASVGESVHNSDCVRLACEWLRQPYPDGPFQLGTWQSGTGTWNTPMATTAMCVLALIRCGIPSDDQSVKAGHAYLLQKRSAWLDPGREMDAAEALQVLLLSGDDWRARRGDLGKLLRWAQDREAWDSALASAAEVQDESSKVPSIAGSLIRLVWTILNADISLLMEGVAAEMSSSLLRTATEYV
jgi:nucleoside phosphorylase